MPSVAYKLYVAWDKTNYIDESANFISATGTFRLTPFNQFASANSGTVDSAHIVLRYASTYRTALTNGTVVQSPVRLDVSINGGPYNRIFTGVVTSAAARSITAKSAGEIDLRCNTLDYNLLQRKLNTTQAEFKALYGAGATETTWFNSIITAAGSNITTDFDPGIVHIPWLWADDESALDEMWQAAAAAGGMLYCTRTGVLTYRNISSVGQLVSQSPTVISRNSGHFGASTISTNDSNLYSEVTVQAAPRFLGREELLWQSDEQNADPQIAPQSTLVITATYDTPVYSVSSIEWEAATANGEAAGASVTLSSVVHYAAKSIYTFSNSSSTPAFLKFLRVSGYPVQGAPIIEYKAVKTPWTLQPRARSMYDNPYVQSTYQAKLIADVILEESSQLRPVVYLSHMPGNTARFVGDVVQIQDSQLLSSNVTGQIELISWRTSPRFEEDIVVRSFGTTFQYSPYFIIGTDSVGGARRIFY